MTRLSEKAISSIGFMTQSGDGNLAALEAGLRRFAELGATAAELSLYAEELVVGGRVVPSRAAKLQRMTKQYNFQYSVHGLVSSNFMDEENLDYQVAAAVAMLELCDLVGAGVLVHHSGHIDLKSQANLRDAEQREAESLLKLAERARAYGVRVAVENIFSMGEPEYRRAPSDLAQLLKTLDHPNLCGLLDFSHAYIECTRKGLDFMAEIAALAPVTGHLHVHDSLGRPYTHKTFYHPSEATILGIGDLHLPIGWGDIPWNDIFTNLTFLDGSMMILEIQERRFNDELQACLEDAQALAVIAEARKAG